MMQPTWSRFPNPAFDPAPLAIGAEDAGAFRPQSLAGYETPPATSDAISRPWFAPAPGDAASFASGFAGNSIYALVRNLVNQLQQLAASMFGEGRVETGPQQRVVDGTFSSTGDPHLAETATVQGPNGNRTVDNHFDSMVAHDDLLHSTDVAGGYRVSTTVTNPNANGVTWNASATVHTNFDRDRIAMNGDGSIAITDQGRSVSISPGQTLTLSAGETVMENADRSLLVSAGDGFGGTIATTMRTNGTGVDVSTHATNIDIGGDMTHDSARPRPRSA